MPTTPSEDVIKAQAAERGRIAARIVDGPAQMLANIILEAEICERLLDRDIEQCRAAIVSLREMPTRTQSSLVHWRSQAWKLSLSLTPFREPSSRSQNAFSVIRQ